jgi:LysW-gamma-L-lysine carboxypeptidase
LAAQAVRPSIVDGPWSIVVIGAVEEEAATSKGARFAATQYRPEFCVIGEPSGVDGITLGYKGRLLAHARFERAAQHTAVPGQTVSEQAVALWSQVKVFADAYNTGKDKAFDQILPSLRRIQSGDDGLREWCDMSIGARLPIDLGPQEMEDRIRAWASQADLPPPAGGHSPSTAPTPSTLRALDFTGHERAYRTSKDTRLARVFVDAIRAQKLRPAFKHKTGTADFNVVGPTWQCPMVAYGPGDSALDHTPHEHVAIDEFEKAAKVLSMVLQALTGP